MFPQAMIGVGDSSARVEMKLDLQVRVAGKGQVRAAQVRRDRQ